MRRAWTCCAVLFLLAGTQIGGCGVGGGFDLFRNEDDRKKALAPKFKVVSGGKPVKTILTSTDLGNSFEHSGKLWLLFRDKIAWTTGTDADSLQLTSLPRTQDIPLDGISDGNTMYVWFATGTPRRSILMKSIDEAKTWKKVYEFGTSRFVHVTADVMRKTEIPGLGSGDWVVVFGSGHLAVAPLQSLRNSDRGALRFFRGEGKWSVNEEDAAPLFQVGSEKFPSVHYCESAGAWLALYGPGTSIQMRTAAKPWGPWNDGIAVAGGTGYAPFVVERFTKSVGGGVSLVFLMSTRNPTTVVLVQTTLQRK